MTFGIHLFCLLSFLLNEHAIYIGVIQVDHTKESTTAQLTIKVFTDDLQDALRNEFPAYQSMSKEAFCDTNESFLESYFQKHLTGEINQKTFTLSLASCRFENDASFLQFEMPCPEKWKTFDLQADFFMELFPDQSNILNLNNDGEKRFHRMTSINPTYETYF